MALDELPDVFSIQPGDPGYRADWPTFAARINVFVDGVKQEKVVSYDAPAGVVIKRKLDRAGGYVLADGGAHLANEEVRGVVTLEERTGC
jgi:hypothetical protein